MTPSTSPPRRPIALDRIQQLHHRPPLNSGDASRHIFLLFHAHNLSLHLTAFTGKQQPSACPRFWTIKCDANTPGEALATLYFFFASSPSAFRWA